VKPALVLVVLPVLIGILAEAIFRDARRSSFAAVAGSAAMTLAAVLVLDTGSAWNWLAAVMVLPIPISIAVCVAQFCYGRMGRSPRHAHRNP
jgi:hypothetical protein